LSFLLKQWQILYPFCKSSGEWARGYGKAVAVSTAVTVRLRRCNRKEMINTSNKQRTLSMGKRQWVIIDHSPSKRLINFYFIVKRFAVYLQNFCGTGFIKINFFKHIHDGIIFCFCSSIFKVQVFYMYMLCCI
jgi:hypothetical protein